MFVWCEPPEFDLGDQKLSVNPVAGLTFNILKN